MDWWEQAEIMDEGLTLTPEGHAGALCSHLRSAWRRPTATSRTSCHFLPGRYHKEKQDVCHSKATGESQDKERHLSDPGGVGGEVRGAAGTDTRVKGRSERSLDPEALLLDSQLC